MKKLLSLLLLCPFIVFAQDELTTENYRVYSTKISKEISLKEMVAEMDNYEIMLFGEEHNDSVTHFLEQSVLELMYLKYGADLALSMEMFDRDVQTVMNEYLNDFIKEKHFKKDARVWSNYNDYRPMVEFAKDKKLDVICANAPTRYTNLAGRKGEEALENLPYESKDFFAPLPYDTATGRYHAKLLEMMGGHGSSAPMGMGGFNIIVAQSLWDATMAYSIAGYYKKHKNNKIMHINGKFHSDEGFAVATQLYKYNSKLKTMIISTASDDDFPNIDWEKYKKIANYIIITDPKVPKTY